MPFYYVLLSSESSALAIYLNMCTTDFFIILIIIKQNVTSINLVKYVKFSKGLSK